jgi:hypothetical protein
MAAEALPVLPQTHPLGPKRPQLDTAKGPLAGRQGLR